MKSLFKRGVAALSALAMVLTILPSSAYGALPTIKATQSPAVTLSGTTVSGGALTEGERTTISITPDASTSFTFTPAETGYYVLYVEKGIDENDNKHYPFNSTYGLYDMQYEGSRTHIGVGTYYYYYLTAGTDEDGNPLTYTMALSDHGYTYDTGVCITKAKAPTGVTVEDASGFVGTDVNGEPRIALVRVDFANYDEFGAVTWNVADPTVASVKKTEGTICTLNMLQVGTTTLTVTTENGYSDSCTVYVNDVGAVTPNTTVSEYFEAFENKMYSFTADQTGWYVLYVSKGTDSQGYLHTMGTGGSFDATVLDEEASCGYMYAEEGATGYFQVSNMDSEAVNASFEVRMAQKPASAEVNPMSGYVDHTVPFNVYFDSLLAYDPIVKWEIADETIAKLVQNIGLYGEVQLLKEGTTTLTITTESGLTATSVITAVEPHRLQLGEAFELSIPENGMVETVFTPTESGWYVVTMPDMVIGENFYEVHNVSGLTVKRDGVQYAFFKMTAGKQEYVRFYSVHIGLDRPLTTTATITKATLPTQLVMDSEWTGYIGDEKYFHVDMFPNGAMSEVTWSVADPSVAEIVELYTNDFTSCKVQLKDSGTTTLTATTANGLTVTCTITASAKPTLRVDQQTTVTLAPGEEKTYSFTPGGLQNYRYYAIYMPAVTVNGEKTYVQTDWSDYGYLDSADGRYQYYKLYKDREYSFTVRNPFDETVTFDLTLYEAQRPSIMMLDYAEGKVGDTITVRLHYDSYLHFEPVDTWLIGDENIAEMWSAGLMQWEVRLKNVGTCNMRVDTVAGDIITSSVTVIKPTELTFGTAQQVILSREEEKQFCFTAEEAGVYVVWMPAIQTGYGTQHLSVDYLNASCIYNKSTDNGSYYFVRVEAGQVCVFNVCNWSGDDLPLTGSVTAQKADTPTAITTHNTTLSNTVGHAIYVELNLDPDTAYSDITWTIADPSIVEFDYSHNFYASLRLKAGGTTTVTATTANGLSVTITVVSVAPIELTLDKTENITLSFVDSNVLRFTAPETGIYTLAMPNIFVDDVSYFFNVSQHHTGDEEKLDDAQYFYFTLHEGETVEIHVENRNNATLTGTATMRKGTAPTSITMREPVMSGQLYEQLQLYVDRTPAGSFPQLSWTVADESIVELNTSNNFTAVVTLRKAGTTTVTATTPNGLSVTCTITVTAGPALTEDEAETITVESGASVQYTFTPSQSGVYVMYVPGVWMEDPYMPPMPGEDSSKMLYRLDIGGPVFMNIATDDGSLAYYKLTAGETYIIHFYNNHWMESPLTTTATIQKASVPTDMTLECIYDAGEVGGISRYQVNFTPFNAYAEVTWTVADPEMVNMMADGTFCQLELLKAGITTLMATTAGGLTQSITVTVATVPELAEDTTTDFTLDMDGVQSYYFQPAEDGRYVLFIPAADADSKPICPSVELEGASQLAMKYTDDGLYVFYELYSWAGRYKLTVRNPEKETLSSSVLMRKAATPTSITLNPSAVTVKEGEGTTVHALFDSAFAYDIISWSASNTCVELNWDGMSCWVDGLKDGTSVLTVTTDGGLTATCTITVQGTPKLNVGKETTVTVPGYSEMEYAFTATNAGTYVLFIPVSEINDNTEQMISASVQAACLDEIWTDDGMYIYMSCERLETYTVYFRNHYEKELSANVLVRRASTPSKLTLSGDPSGYVGDMLWVEAQFASMNQYGKVTWTVSDDKIAQITDARDTSCGLRLLQPGTTTLTATANSGKLTATMTITVQSQTALTLGQTSALNIASQHNQQFLFTPDADGIYAVTVKYTDTEELYLGWSSSKDEAYADCVGHDMINGGMVEYYKLTGGVTYTIMVHNSDEANTVTGSICITRPGTPTAVHHGNISGIVGEYYIGYTDYIPEGSYDAFTGFTSADATIADVPEYAGNAFFLVFLKPGVTTVTGTTESGLTVTFTVTVVQKTELTLDEPLEITVPGNNFVNVTFTPEKTGDYVLTVPTGGENDAKFWFELYQELGYTYTDSDTRSYFKLEAGTTYTFPVRNPTDAETVASVQIQLAEEATDLTLRTPVTAGFIDDFLEIYAQFAPLNGYSVITWEVEDDSIAKINWSDTVKCQIHLVGAGSTVITAKTANGLKMSVTVTAEKQPLVVASGWSGDLEWMLYDDGVLKFVGSGNMKHYSSKTAMPWYSYRDQIVSVVLENGVTRIGDNAFYGMPNLEHITMPASLTTIGDYAFKNCTKLNTVTLPENLSSLGDSAFYACTSLTSIEIPASLWTIKPYTFKNCTNLTSVKFNEGNLQKISDGAFYGTGLTELVLPDCLDILDVYAFKGCAKLASITIGKGLTELREAVFYGTAISTITIPEGITKIGPYVFKNCTKLETIGLPTTLTSIGEAAFYDCAKLQSVTLPDEVKTIGNYAFRRCVGLADVTFGSGLQTIGESSFYGCTGLVALIIPDSVTTIKGYAFKGCTWLTSVQLGSGLTSIGESAFHTCTKLKTLTFPGSVTSIGAYCFSGSYNLWKLTFEGNAPAIGSGAFKGLAATAYYPAGNATWTSANMLNYGGTVTWKAQ